jgi:golgi-specific brefeldin A-resistance guanine nucleotide exchange factor 1
MGRPRPLAAGGIDPIVEEPPHAHSPADGVPDPAALACAISAQASVVLTVMRRDLRYPRADDAVAADHPLVASLRALRHLTFFPAATAVGAALRPFLDAIRFEEAGAIVTSTSLVVTPRWRVL